MPNLPQPDLRTLHMSEYLHLVFTISTQSDVWVQISSSKRDAHYLSEKDLKERGVSLTISKTKMILVYLQNRNMYPPY